MLYLVHHAPVAFFIFLITIATSLIAMFQDQRIYDTFIFNPYQINKKGEYYRFITHGLIHGDFTHLFFNMFSFYFFAFTLEVYIGHWQFAVLYIGSLILSDLQTFREHKNNPHYNSLGASGAISAVIFAFILFQPTASIYLFFIKFPAWAYGLFYLVYSWYMAKNDTMTNIGHSAHFYGAISGLLIMAIIDPEVVQYFVYQMIRYFTNH